MIDFTTFRDSITTRIVGQPHGVDALVNCAQVWQAGLCDPSRPAGVFMMRGTTGTGKTYTAECFSRALHGKEPLRIDCGEFQMEHEVARLTGAPPGYLGHGETSGLLSSKNAINHVGPDCRMGVLILDEIEKACVSMLRLLLGILDKGTLRMGDNKAVNFADWVIVMTSNISEDRLRSHFAPEFLNRIDEIIEYRPFSIADLSEIVVREVAKLQSNLKTAGKDVTVTVSPAAAKWIAREGASAEYGARHLRRAVQRLVRQPLARMIVNGEVGDGGEVRVERVANVGVEAVVSRRGWRLRGDSEDEDMHYRQFVVEPPDRRRRRA